MATSLKSDFQIYNEFVHTAFVETLMQNSNIFNTASNGSIVLTDRSLLGDFYRESFWKNISNAVSRTDLTSSGDATALKLEGDEHVSPKLSRTYGPVEITRNSMTKQGFDPETVSMDLGVQIAKNSEVDRVNTMVDGLVGALSGVSDLNHDATDGTIETTDLVTGLSKMGDAAQNIVAWVMHSKVYFDLVKDQIADKIDGVSNFNIFSGTPVTMNRPVIVTDSANMIDSNLYYTFGLVNNGVTVYDSEDLDLWVEDVTGKKQLIKRIQGEWAYNLRIAGAKFTTGTDNPDASALSNTSNWTQVASDVKSMAGVVIQSQ